VRTLEVFSRGFAVGEGKRAIMTDTMQRMFWIVVFPGFAFTLFLGLLAGWVVRKVSALVQWRVGPPLCQPFMDVLKLMGKETLIPADAHRTMFILAPVVGFSGILVLAAMLWQACLNPQAPFVGDVIVAMYIMVLPSLALIIGSSASASPHAAFGASREMKLILGYELPLVLALIVVITKSGGQLSLAALAGQTPVLSVSGLIGFLVSLLCVQAKLGFVPFDIAEAETEVSSGVLIEYSGTLLAIWKIMQALMLVALPLFLVVVFMGGLGTSGWPLVWGICKLVLVLVLVILIKNTNPRLRIDQAVRFFWVYCGTAAAAAVILAAIGRGYGIGWL